MISRRQFLQMGSVAALSAPVAFRAMPTAVDDARPGKMEFLPVGFWAGHGDPVAMGSILTHRRSHERKARLSHEILAEGGPFHPDVVAATSLLAGDPEFRASGARLTVHGLMTAKSPWVRPRLESLALDVHFGAGRADDANAIPCAAWHYRRTPAPSISPPVAMTVPLSQASDLRLSLEGRRGARGLLGRVLAPVLGHDASSREAVRHGVRFTTGSRGGAAKLRSGVYFFAWLRPGEAAPRWSDYQFRAIPALGGARVLVRRGILGLEAPDFDYLVASVSRPAAAPSSLAS